MRIGIIGSGMMGATLAKLWVKAGHEVLLSSRHPDGLSPIVRGIGVKACAGSVAEAAAFGDAVLLAVPFHAYPSLGAAIAPALVMKLVLDAGNPIERRDGTMAKESADAGSGLYTARQFPGAHVVKAYNTIYFVTLERASGRPPPRVGVPLAGDDQGALEIAKRLVEDSGFEPVVVGSLSRARDFDPGTPAWNSGKTAAELRALLGVRDEST
ncbi:MAG: NADPH-dependent F420 reductase [Deltaproteobacteria bacterium]|nr:NADPH-dependent F420 reductase [Deltaproteobacteria bacterium]